MRAYKMWTVKPDPDTKEHPSFYFKKQMDANRFKEVFKDRFIHVDFMGEWVDVPVELENVVKDEIILNPEIRAEDNAEWGIEFAKKHGDDKLTRDEKRFLSKLNKKTNSMKKKNI